jgi:hypothetical protein
MINKKTDGVVWLPTKKTSLVQKSALLILQERKWNSFLTDPVRGSARI